MRTLRRALRRSCGFSMVELLMGALVAAIAVAVVTAWLVAATRVDLDQDAEFQGLNELRAAKSQMTKELRFADGALTAANPDSIEIWVDLDGNGTGPDSPGEKVIWRIMGDELIRYTDDNLATAVTWAEGLNAAQSSLTLTNDLAEIVLVVNVTRGATGIIETRSIETRVNLRNV